MIRFLPGIILIQLATGAVIFALVNAPLDGNQIYVIGLLGLLIAVLTAFWFSSISGNLNADTLAKVKDGHAQEREKLRVNAERQKTRLVKESHKQITTATNRAHAKASFKVGGMFAAAVGLGGLMIFTQFLTLGLLILTTSGGAMVGYMTRLRQEKAAALLPANQTVIRTIEVDATPSSN